MVVELNVAPTYHPPPNATSNVLARMRKTCSITSSPCYTTLPTKMPTPMHSGPKGRASRFRAGPTATMDGAAGDAFAASAARGRELAALLDSDTPVPGVTTGALRPEAAAVAVPSTVGRRQHGRRRLRADGGLGPLRAGRGRHAGAGPRRRARHTPRTSAPRWAKPPARSATRRSTSTSTAAPTGATSPPPSGATSSAGTRC